MARRYRIKSMGAGSAKYGPCEICGERCAEVFLVVAEERSSDRDGEFWYYPPDNTRYGHEACVRSWQRRDEYRHDVATNMAEMGRIALEGMRSGK